jgi:hypothetical protein
MISADDVHAKLIRAVESMQDGAAQENPDKVQHAIDLTNSLALAAIALELRELRKLKQAKHRRAGLGRTIE